MADISAVWKMFGSYMTKTEAVTKPIDQLTKLDKMAGNVVKQFQKGISAVESYVETNAKLGQMTKSLEEQAILQEQIFNAANNARSSYTDMADTVTKLGLYTGKLFFSNEEVVSFSEQLQKSLIASGTSDDKKAGVMQAMENALVSGSMNKSGLELIAQNAPVIYEAIQKYTKKSGKELLDMANSGDLTAVKIKESLFWMQGLIEERFSQMPLTFSVIMERVKNAGIDAFGNLFVSINNLLTSQRFIDFFNQVINIIYFLGDAIDKVVSLITEYWPVIESFLMAIGILLKTRIIKLLPVIIGQLLAMIPILLTNLGIFMANNALAILLVAGLTAAIFVLRTFGEEIFSFIGSIIGSVIAFIVNVIVTIVQIIIGIVEFVVNTIAAVFDFLDNAGNKSIGSIILLFIDLANVVLDVLDNISAAIDFTFGSDLNKTVKGWKAKVQLSADKIMSENKDGSNDKTHSRLDINQFLEDNGFPLNGIDYSKAWEKGGNIGGEFGKAVEKFFGGGDPDSNTNMSPESNTKKGAYPDIDAVTSWLNNIKNKFKLDGEDPLTNSDPSKDNKGYDPSAYTDYSNIGNGAGRDVDYNMSDIFTNTNPLPIEGTGPNGSVNVEMPDDDLDYLRDIAERDYIANVATNSLAPNISIQFGDVHENADANKVAGRIREILQNEIAVASEG